ncbi:cytochrome P450 2B1-like [Rana temporaria]|uniref:cytochrome P450 2B1-like n=1 Tax=Rana temporaria TaxID=8407 RepID=UPI001AAC9F4F|nr:cytochrome P450 2B1-like [Rana temporaria]
MLHVNSLCCFPISSRIEDTSAMDLVTIILSIILILLLVKIYYDQKPQYDDNYPPGPKPLPFIGNLHLILFRKRHCVFMKLSEEYGTVFSIKLGPAKMVILCGFDTIKEALINHAEEFSERPHVLTSRTSLSDGIVFAHGENWKVIRKFTLSALRELGMGKRSIENKIQEEAQCLIQAIKSYKGEPFENMTIINAAVANIIVFFLLDDRFEYDDPTLLKLIHHIHVTVRNIGSFMNRLYRMFPRLVGLLPGRHLKDVENMEDMHALINKVFTEQRSTVDINDPKNLIDAFRAKQQKAKPDHISYFDNESLTMLVSDLFGAGMESTSATLRWGLLLMIKHPEIQQKVQNEIYRVIGSTEPQTEHRKQLPYTDAVIHEIQRFADVVPLNVPHETTNEVMIRGHYIPLGTIVFPMLTSALRDKDYFEKPYEFYPEHFLDSEGNFKKNEAFIPFSLGKRSCAGENLAKMEIFLFFTSLLQNFTFQAPPRAKLNFTPASGFTNAPLPQKICAIPRS